MSSPRACPSSLPCRGFGTVELLVGVAIALLGLLAMSEAFMLFDLQRRISGGGMDAQTSAATSLFGLEREAQQAGLGFADQRFTGCALAFAAGGATQTLAPVRITVGSKGAPDTLTLLIGERHAMATPLVSDLATAAGEIVLGSTLGMAANDVLLLQESGKPCSLARIGAILSNQRASRVALDGAALSSGNDTVPASGYSTDALAIDVGALSAITYSIDASGLLRRQDAPGASGSDAAIASDIVSLKAQYGFDTRSGVRTDFRVDRWSATIIDADGDGTVGSAGDVQRIAALRLALVARSTARVQRGDSCNATTAAPQWEAADASGTLGQRDISLTHLSAWKCHRYRVYQAVIPLRNPLWGMP
jgi:type IV pilus assembly protein PilW